jgi:nicotinate-nucleotide--dimethylbenzimidazole phosphoribosyltransferase
VSASGVVPPPREHGGDGRAVAVALGLDPRQVLDLSQSLNPVAPDPAEVVTRHAASIGSYPDPAQATEHLASVIGVDPSRVLLTNGGSEAISLVAAEIGGRVREPEFGLHPRCSGPLWRSNPHNPSGLLASAAERADVWDEAFYPLATGRWTRGDPDAVVVGSLTKLWACPGLRVGYVIAEPELIARVRQRQPRWSVNGLATSSLGELLTRVDLPGWSAAVRDLRERLVEVLARHGLVASPSDASWVLVQLPELRDRLAPMGVMVRDCTNFGLPGVARIAVPSEAGLARLDDALSRIDRPTSARRGNPRKDPIMSSTKFADAARSVSGTDEGAAADARALQDRLTKPRGALGRLEELGSRLAAMAGRCPPPMPEPVTVAVFAGDHGVVDQGVTPWPREVTAQMVANFCAEGAAVNAIARQVGARVLVVDVGVATPIPSDAAGLLRRNVRLGTRDLAEEPAMSDTEVLEALSVGVEVAELAIDEGARLLVMGDMGIGNTTASAATIAALTGRSAAEVTGRGTGVDDAMLSNKQSVVERALSRLAPGSPPLQVLAEVGGLEIAALAGFVVGAAARQVPIVVDGVIAAAAALAAVACVPDTAGYLVAGHRSSEPGSTVVLEHLGLQPVLDLDLRLGEGTGALLAVPVVQAAARVLNEMATFDGAGVTDKGDPRD